MPTYPKPYIYTYGGNRLYYPDGDADTFSRVDLQDVARHLSQETRFTGATREPYWIGQHAVVVVDILASWNCDTLTQLYGLHHDDHEFCMGDPPTPFQVWLRKLNGGRDIVEEAKAKLDDMIMPQMGLIWPPQPGIWEVVKRADAAAFVLEASQLFHVAPDWLDQYVQAKAVPRVDMTVHFMSSSAAFELFMDTHQRLTQELKGDGASG